MKKKELEIAITTYTVAYKNGYSQCQEDMDVFLNDIREMLLQGALSNMSCSSAIVEFDKLKSKKSF